MSPSMCAGPSPLHISLRACVPSLSVCVLCAVVPVVVWESWGWGREELHGLLRSRPHAHVQQTKTTTTKHLMNTQREHSQTRRSGGGRSEGGGGVPK